MNWEILEGQVGEIKIKIISDLLQWVLSILLSASFMLNTIKHL